MLFFSKLSELSEIGQSYLWSPGWCPAYKYGGFLWGVRWLWNHFRAILLKPVLPRNTDSSRVDVVKGEAEEKDTMLNSFNTNGTFPSWFFPLNFFTKISLLKIQWDPMRVCPCGAPWVFYASYKSLTSFTIPECAVCRQMRGSTQVRGIY